MRKPKRQELRAVKHPAQYLELGEHPVLPARGSRLGRQYLLCAQLHTRHPGPWERVWSWAQLRPRAPSLRQQREGRKHPKVQRQSDKGASGAVPGRAAFRGAEVERSFIAICCARRCVSPTLSHLKPMIAVGNKDYYAHFIDEETEP